MKNTKPWKGSRSETIDLTMPCQFLMLCALAGVSPETMLYDFMTCVGAESYSQALPARKQAKEYFIRAGYGSEYYNEAEIRQMFRELEAISELWPKDASAEFTTRHANWRDAYHEHWFKRWYWKIRRKLPGNGTNANHLDPVLVNNERRISIRILNEGIS